MPAVTLSISMAFISYGTTSSDFHQSAAISIGSIYLHVCLWVFNEFRICCLRVVKFHLNILLLFFSFWEVEFTQDKIVVQVNILKSFNTCNYCLFFDELWPIFLLERPECCIPEEIYHFYEVSLSYSVVNTSDDVFNHNWSQMNTLLVFMTWTHDIQKLENSLKQNPVWSLFPCFMLDRHVN